MKLTGRSISWTVIAAVLTVLLGLVVSRLSSDALGMMVGIGFGMLAMIPAVAIAYSAGKDAGKDGEIDTPAYRAGCQYQRDLALAFRKGEEHACYRLSMGDVPVRVIELT